MDGLCQIVQMHHSLRSYAGIPEDETGHSLLWYTNNGPAKRFQDFHAPSWPWASLNDGIEFDLDLPSGADSRSLVENLNIEVEAVCRDDKSKNPQCRGTCVSGQVRLTCSVGRIWRSVGSNRYNTDAFDAYILENTLGAEKDSPYPQSFRETIPYHAELLFDKYDQIVGLFIPDVGKSPQEELIPISCVCIVMSTQTATRELRPDETQHLPWESYAENRYRKLDNLLNF